MSSAIRSGLYVRQFNLLMRRLRAGLLMSPTWLRSLMQSQPHAAYSAFTKGLSSCWIYISRIFPNIVTFMQPLEDVICYLFIPALTGRAPPNEF